MILTSNVSGTLLFIAVPLLFYGVYALGFSQGRNAQGPQPWLQTAVVGGSLGFVLLVVAMALYSR